MDINQDLLGECVKKFGKDSLDDSFDSLYSLYLNNPKAVKKTILKTNVIPFPLNIKQEEIDMLNNLNERLRTQIALKQNDIVEYKSELLESMENDRKFFETCLIPIIHNSKLNTNRLTKNLFSKKKLYEQIILLCMYMEDQFRLSNSHIEKLSQGQLYTTGLEGVNTKDVFPDEEYKTSLIENTEHILNGVDTLVRYLFYVNKKELLGTLPTNTEIKNITHLNDPIFEEFVNLGFERNSYEYLWDKVKYSNWMVRKGENEEMEYIFSAPDKSSIQHYVGRLSSNYLIMQDIYSYNEKNSVDSIKASQYLNLIADQLNPNDFDLCNLEIDKDIYKLASIDYSHRFKAETSIALNDMYNEYKVENISLDDIIKTITFLCAIANVHKIFIKNNFDEHDDSMYHLLVPSVNINRLSALYSSVSNYSTEQAEKLIKYFVFTGVEKKYSEILTHPLISVSQDSVVFCSNLILSINLSRKVEMLFQEKQVDLMKTGPIFEKELIKLVENIPKINVNTNKLKYEAFDGKDIEFDFFATWNDFLIVAELKNVVTPYDDYRLHIAKGRIKEGVEQVTRRIESIKRDWDLIKKLVNISLPIKPYKNHKIIKLVVTNIRDFNTLEIDGVKIIDLDSLRYYFNNTTTTLRILGREKSISKESVREKGSLPTTSKFIQYIKTPFFENMFYPCIKDRAIYLNSEGYKITIEDYHLYEDPIKKYAEKVMSNGDVKNIKLNKKKWTKINRTRRR